MMVKAIGPGRPQAFQPSVKNGRGVTSGALYADISPDPLHVLSLILRATHPALSPGVIAGGTG
jgi:hypothetical protein